MRAALYSEFSLRQAAQPHRLTMVRTIRARLTKNIALIQCDEQEFIPLFGAGQGPGRQRTRLELS